MWSLSSQHFCKKGHSCYWSKVIYTSEELYYNVHLCQVLPLQCWNANMDFLYFCKKKKSLHFLKGTHTKSQNPKTQNVFVTWKFETTSQSQWHGFECYGWCSASGAFCEPSRDEEEERKGCYQGNRKHYISQGILDITYTLRTVLFFFFIRGMLVVVFFFFLQILSLSNDLTVVQNAGVVCCLIFHHIWSMEIVPHEDLSWCICHISSFL